MLSTVLQLSLVNQPFMTDRRILLTRFESVSAVYHFGK